MYEILLFIQFSPWLIPYDFPVIIIIFFQLVFDVKRNKNVQKYHCDHNSIFNCFYDKKDFLLECLLYAMQQYITGHTFIWSNFMFFYSQFMLNGNATNTYYTTHLTIAVHHKIELWKCGGK